VRKPAPTLEKLRKTTGQNRQAQQAHNREMQARKQAMQLAAQASRSSPAKHASVMVLVSYRSRSAAAFAGALPCTPANAQSKSPA